MVMPRTAVEAMDDATSELPAPASPRGMPSHAAHADACSHKACPAFRAKLAAAQPVSAKAEMEGQAGLQPGGRAVGLIPTRFHVQH